MEMLRMATWQKKAWCEVCPGKQVDYCWMELEAGKSVRLLPSEDEVPESPSLLKQSHRISLLGSVNSNSGVVAKGRSGRKVRVKQLRCRWTKDPTP